MKGDWVQQAGFVGLAPGADTVFVCAEGALEVPPALEIGGRRLRTRVLSSGRFFAAAGRGPILPSAFRGRRRPVQAGYSLGTSKTVGTAGLLTAPAQGPFRAQVLTACHVVSRALKLHGIAVLQPAGPDGGLLPEDGIGKITSVLAPARRGTSVSDAALVELAPGVAFDAAYPGFGPLRGHCAVVRPGWTVYKAGRSTGLISGRILSTDWSGFVDYAGGRCWFTGQLLIEGLPGPAALPGDSGSVWVTDSGYAVALSFSATDRKGRYSIATPIHRVLEAFDARVITLS